MYKCVDKGGLIVNNCQVAKTPILTAKEKERRLREQNFELQARLKRSPSAIFGVNRFGPLMFAAAFGLIGIYFAVSSYANPTVSYGRTVNLSLEPSDRKVVRGQTLTVRVWADSLNHPMGAVQARLMYPADKFEFVTVDTTASAFITETAAATADGTVLLSRSTPDGLTGRQFVAKVTFRAKSTAGSASLWFAEDSKVLRSTDQANILEETSGGQYVVSMIAPPFRR